MAETRFRVRRRFSGVLQQKFKEMAVTDVQAFLQNYAEAAFASYVSCLLCETGKMQLNAHAYFDAYPNAMTAKVLTHAKGSDIPLFGHDRIPQQGMRSPQTYRHSKYIKALPDNVKVSVRVADGLAEQLMQKPDDVKMSMRMTTTRMASEEPLVAEYLRQHGYADFSLTAVHHNRIQSRYSANFQQYFKSRFDAAGMRKAAKRKSRGKS